MAINPNLRRRRQCSIEDSGNIKKNGHELIKHITHHTSDPFPSVAELIFLN
jgi:hypothetical protein